MKNNSIDKLHSIVLKLHNDIASKDFLSKLTEEDIDKVGIIINTLEGLYEEMYNNVYDGAEE